MAKTEKMNEIMKGIMILHALHHYTIKKWFLTSLSVFKYNKTPKICTTVVLLLADHIANAMPV